MGKFLVKFLEPGMRITKNICDDLGTVLYPANTEISQEVISDLNSRNIMFIFISANEFSLDNLENKLVESDVPTVISSEMRSAVFENIHTISQSIAENNDFDIEETEFLADQMVQQIVENRDAAVNLIDLKTYDDYTFAHSVNVSVLSILIANELEFDRNELFTVAMGSILHDIGKILIDEEILNKKGRLTREEFWEMMKHPEVSYKLLKNKDLDDNTLSIPLEHHEWLDGTGYPQKLKGHQISIYSRICVIADVYDALTSNRAYQKAISPHLAIKMMMSQCETHFDHELMRYFVQRMTLYPIGTIVRVNDGRYAVVIENHRHQMVRPRIRFLNMKEDGDFEDSGKELNLSKSRDVFIKYVVESQETETLDFRHYNKTE